MLDCLSSVVMHCRGVKLNFLKLAKNIHFTKLLNITQTLLFG